MMWHDLYSMVTFGDWPKKPTERDPLFIPRHNGCRRNLVLAAIDAELDARPSFARVAAEIAANHPQPKDARSALKLLQLMRSAARPSRPPYSLGAVGGVGSTGEGANPTIAQADAVVAAVAAVSKANRLSAGTKESEDDDAVVLEVLASETARDNTARTELELMRQHAHVRNWQKLRSAHAAVSSNNLKRLLTAQLDSSGMLEMQMKDRAFVESLIVVKRALDEAAIESAKGSSGVSHKSAAFKKHIGFMRGGRFDMVRLPMLVGKEDAKNSSPLAGFENVQKAKAGGAAMDYSADISDPAIVFREAMLRLQTAYMTYHPGNVEAAGFFDTLTTRILEANTKGVSWKTIGDKVWVPLMARLSHEFEVFRRSDTRHPEINARWLSGAAEMETLRDEVLMIKSERAAWRGAGGKSAQRQYSAPRGSASSSAAPAAAADKAKTRRGKKRKQPQQGGTGDDAQEAGPKGGLTQM